MIEPLRYHNEVRPPQEILRPVFCSSCLAGRQTKNDPNIAVVYCVDCPAVFGETGPKGAYICSTCDVNLHKAVGQKSHVRHIVVVGPGVRKQVITRGDAKNFPLPLDQITIKLKSRVFHMGKRLHVEPTKYITYTAGMSGKCIHIQVLGARDLAVKNGTSDPFVLYSYYGRPLGSTRVRPRTLYPSWDNETFIVPVEELHPLPRGGVEAQRDLVKMEVFDYDWLGYA